MKLVYGSSCEESLRFKPAEVLKMTANHLNIRQDKNETSDEFARKIKKQSKTLLVILSLYFAGMGILAHLMSRDNLELKDYFNPNKVDEAKRERSTGLRAWI